MNDDDLVPISSFLGRGWSFPPEFDAATGSVRMTEDEDDIAASLRVLLGTTAGERLLHPKYGLNMQEYLFEPLNTGMQTLLKDRVKINILVYEPRINLLLLDVDVSQQLQGKIIFTLEYEIRATNSRFNLVYPFYLTDGNEVSSSVGAAS